MPRVSRKLSSFAWRVMPERLRRRLQSNGGRRLVRFAPAAVLALAATQITYFVMFSLLHAGGFTSGAVGWFAGFVVSYGISRWAWERKGRPDLLRETLPFLLVSLTVGVVLTLTSKFASTQAAALGLTGAGRALFAQSLYLAANCVTFAMRFLIFHYLLFADRGGRTGAGITSAGPAGPAGPAERAEPALDGQSRVAAAANGRSGRARFGSAQNGPSNLGFAQNGPGHGAAPFAPGGHEEIGPGSPWRGEYAVSRPGDRAGQSAAERRVPEPDD